MNAPRKLQRIFLFMAVCCVLPIRPAEGVAAPKAEVGKVNIRFICPRCGHASSGIRVLCSNCQLLVNGRGHQTPRPHRAPAPAPVIHCALCGRVRVPKKEALCPACTQLRGRIVGWQKGEMAALAAAAKQLQNALPVPLDRVSPPPDVPALAAPSESRTYQYRVTLRLVQPNGTPLAQTLVEAAIKSLDPKPDHLEIQGAELRMEFAARPGTLRLQLSDQWKAPGGALVSLNWNAAATRVEDLGTEPLPPPVVRVPALTIAAEPLPHPTQAPLPAKGTPQPALHLKRAADALVAAQVALNDARNQMSQFTDHALTVRPTASEEGRRAAGAAVQQCIIQLNRSSVSQDSCLQAMAALNALIAVREFTGSPKHILGRDFKDFRARLSSQRTTLLRRLAQYRAEALWRLAEIQDPENPDRAGALTVLRLETKSETEAELQPLQRRFEEVQRQEQTAYERLRTRFNPPATVRKLVVQEFERSVSIERQTVAVWLGGVEPGDQPFLQVGGREHELPVRAEVGRVVTDIPVSLLNPIKLHVRRRRATAILEAETSSAVPRLDPYGVTEARLEVGPFRLRQLPPGAFPRDFPSILQPGTRLAGIRGASAAHPLNDFRRSALVTGRMEIDKEIETDGAWWLDPGNPKLAGVRWRVRPLPGTIDPRSGKPNLDGAALVETVRFTHPGVGYLGALHVGSTLEEVVRELGEPDGTGAESPNAFSYLDGAIEVRVRAGRVLHLDIRRPFLELLGHPTRLVALPVVGLNREAGLLYIRTDVDHPLRPDATIPLGIEDKPISIHLSDGNFPLVIKVLSISDQNAECRVMVQHSKARLTKPSRGVLMCLPDPATGALRILATGGR